MGFFDAPVRKGDGRESQDGYPAMADDLAAWPALGEFLTRTGYSDGSCRVPGSALVFVQGGRLKAMLKDADNERVGFLSLDSLDTAWGVLDKHLREGDIDWRADRQPGRRK